MASISVPTAILGAAALGTAGSVASGIIGSNAAKSAAQAQAKAAKTAQNTTLTMFNKTQSNLAPYMAAGASALPILESLTGTNAGGNPLTAPLTAPFQPTEAQLTQTPGYQFTLNQGLKQTENAFAALGLGPGNGLIAGPNGPQRGFLPSGPEAAGVAQFTTGLADQTYQQQFQNYLGQNQQIYNMLGGLSATGQNAAANAGSLGLGFNAQNVGAIEALGAAQASGIVGSANALSAGLTGAAGGLSNAAMLYAISGSGMFGANPAAGGGYPGVGETEALGQAYNLYTP